MVTATGCMAGNNSNEAAKAALISTLEFASQFVDEFPEEARQATADDKDSRRFGYSSDKII